MIGRKSFRDLQRHRKARDNWISIERDPPFAVLLIILTASSSSSVSNWKLSSLLASTSATSVNWNLGCRLVIIKGYPDIFMFMAESRTMRPKAISFKYHFNLDNTRSFGIARQRPTSYDICLKIYLSSGQSHTKLKKK